MRANDIGDTDCTLDGPLVLGQRELSVFREKLVDK
jgi:hypothetical protein